MLLYVVKLSYQQVAEPDRILCMQYVKIKRFLVVLSICSTENSSTMH